MVSVRMIREKSHDKSHGMVSYQTYLFGSMIDIQYTPRNMQMVLALLCFVVVWYRFLPISFRVTSLALGQSYDCPSASEVNLKDMGKLVTWIHKELITERQQNSAQQNQVPISWDILCPLWFPLKRKGGQVDYFVVTDCTWGGHHYKVLYLGD